MREATSRLSRRAVLALGVGAGLVTAVPTTASASTAESGSGGGTSPGQEEILTRLADLERDHSARLGVYAQNTVTGRRVLHRAHERFPLCSTAKTIGVAAVLRDLDRDGEFLARRIRYTGQNTTKSGYAPVTGRPENLANGMTVSELCAAAIDYSDNAAFNLLLRELGSPTAITRFCRSIGDRTTRLDRWEPELNSAEPWRVTDTTTPYAIGRTNARLTLGDALDPGDRARLTNWMLANTTSGGRFRKGLPADWTLADKTGTGEYGTTNDVGIAWTPDRTPVLLAVLSTRPEATASADEPLIAETAALLAGALG